MEIVLANVAAGVISLDGDGRILTINKSAERMLDIEGRSVIGKHYGDVIGQEISRPPEKSFKTGAFVRRCSSSGRSGSP